MDRRRGRGRRRSDAADPLAMRGLLHDLGHQMTTLSYLVEAVRGDVELPGDAGTRLELLSLEMSRLLDILAQEIPGRPGVSAVAEVELRSLAGQVTQLARIAHETSVVLEPGPEVSLEASPALLWRVLTNVVDNAARAAGPCGRVGVVVSAQGERAVVDVIDDGPGFGQGPPGVASLGLGVVTTLLESCGGVMEIRAPGSGGAHVRILVPVRAIPAHAIRAADRAGDGQVICDRPGDRGRPQRLPGRHVCGLDPAWLRGHGGPQCAGHHRDRAPDPAGRVPDRPALRRRQRDHGHQPDARGQRPDQGAGAQRRPGHRRDTAGPARRGRWLPAQDPGGVRAHPGHRPGPARRGGGRRAEARARPAAGPPRRCAPARRLPDRTGAGMPPAAGGRAGHGRDRHQAGSLGGHGADPRPVTDDQAGRALAAGGSLLRRPSPAAGGRADPVSLGLHGFTPGTVPPPAAARRAAADGEDDSGQGAEQRPVGDLPGRVRRRRGEAGGVRGQRALREQGQAEAQAAGPGRQGRVAQRACAQPWLAGK